MSVVEDPIQSPGDPAQKPHDPYQALRYRDFRLLFLGRFMASLGEQMVSVAIGWELFERTRSDLAVGLVGLVQIIPIVVLALPAGHIADRFNRKRLVLMTQTLLTLCSLGLALLSHTQGSLPLMYACLFGIGVGRAFNGPASATLLPQTVPPDAFTSAATWSSSSWQLAAVLGPALGGFIIALQGRAEVVYLLDAIGASVFVICVALIHGRQIALSKEAATFKSLVAGASFIWRTKVILASITLDMFAVFLGGATALLPDYAKNVLYVNASGLGILRAAPSVGALLMALVLAQRPPMQHAGRTLLFAVAGFGAATIVFGLSASFPLSLLMLAILGAMDNISVVIRSTLVLTRTPDEMRGRVSAVNSVFIGASNELGTFESGVAAAAFGRVAAVVGGGIGSIVVVLLIALIWPEVRALGRLGENKQVL